LDVDLEKGMLFPINHKVLSNDMTPTEEDIIKFHREIKERLQTYEKVNRKLGWKYADIKEQVEEQVETRLKIINKYQSIFANVRKKLEQIELENKQTIKINEDLLREKTQEFRHKVRNYSQEGVEKMQSRCTVLNDVNPAIDQFFESLSVRFEEKDMSKRQVENEYYTLYTRELYKHKKK
jgi:predicted RND superfamily exporter protein